MRDGEKYFYSSTVLKEEPVLVTGKETYQPNWSPDGKEVAFLEERVDLKVINLASGDVRTILPGKFNYSYADGDQWYDWSPDGKWFLVSFLSPGRWSSEAGLIAADGKGELINLSKSGYEDRDPHWTLGGEAMLWYTDRHGMRAHGGWGSMDDVFAMFFTQKSWDRFQLSKSRNRAGQGARKGAEGRG